MGTSVLEEIRENLRATVNAACAREGLPDGAITAASVFDQADWFAEHLTTRTSELVDEINEHGFTKLFAAIERVRRSLEAAAAVAFNAAATREVYRADGHRTPQAFLQAAVNVSDRERVERTRIAALVAYCPHAGELLADGTLPVAHAAAVGALVMNDRIPRDELDAVMSAFLMTANIIPHDAYTQRVRAWGRYHDQDGRRPDPDITHRRRNVHLSQVLDVFVLEGQFGAVQGAKLHAILEKFEQIQFDIDWQQAKAIHGDNTCVAHLARNPQQRRADALEAIFLAAIGEGTAKDVEVIINIVTDAHTFTKATHQAAHAAGPHPDTTVDDDVSVDDEPIVDGTSVDDEVSVDDSIDDDDDGDDHDGEGDEVWVMPSPADVTASRRFCHTIDGFDIDPLHALQATLDGYFRAVIIGDDGVIINQGRKQRYYRNNARTAVWLQHGLDNLHRCSSPGCRARARHIDHATEWASTEQGRTDVANGNPDCGHHNLWKTKHGYTVSRDPYGNLRTYRPDGTELHPY